MKKNIIYLFLISTVLIFSSCLKDTQAIDPAGTHNVVEFGNVSDILSASDNPIRLYIAAFPVVPLDTIVVPINYAGAFPASKDIIVKIERQPSLLDTLNSRQFDNGDGTADTASFYEELATNIFTLPASVTIKKGTLGTNLLIPVKVDQIDFNASYVLPLKITDASGEIISGNFNRIVINVSPKNAYDGTYQYNTSANTSLQPNRSTTVTLETIGANTVTLKPGLLGYYSNEVDYTINPATNQITVTCPSLGVQAPPDPRSKYDPATKTLHVYWKQGNGGRTFEETLVYTGPR